MSTLTTDAIATLLNQFSASTNLKAFLTAVLNRLEDSKIVLEYLRDEVNLNDAEGVWLDLIGAIVGVPRPEAVQDPDETFTFDADTTFSYDEDEGFGTLSGLPDGDMEKAGTADYTTLNAATLAKDTGTYRTGVQSLKVTWAGIAQPGVVIAIGTGFTNPTTFSGYVNVEANFSTVDFPRMYQGPNPSLSGATTIWTGTTTTGTWQAMSGALNPANGGYVIIVLEGAAYASDVMYIDDLHFPTLATSTIGGKFNALSGLTTGIYVSDTLYREQLSMKAASSRSKCTVQDVYNAFYAYTGGAATITNNVGEVVVQPSRSLIGEERAQVEELAPIIAGINLTIIS